MDKIEPWNMLWEWFEYVNEDYFPLRLLSFLKLTRPASHMIFVKDISKRYFKSKYDGIGGDYYVMNISGT